MNNIKYKNFMFNEIFDMYTGYFNVIPELEDSGDIPFFSCSAINYGIKGYLKKQFMEDKDCIYRSNAICVTNNGSVGYAYYIDTEFTCNNDITVLYLKNREITPNIGNYLASIIMAERFRWCYGRKWKMNRMKNSILRLPVDDSSNVNWSYIEEYIDSFKINHLTTKNKDTKFVLDTNLWKSFKLSDFFKISYGNKLDLNKQTTTTKQEGGINFVSRDSKNNGVVAAIEPIEGVFPFPKYSITVTLGGSYLGTSFIQRDLFYTAQNIAVLEPKEHNKLIVNEYHKLFILPLIRFEAKTKFCAFGRELNKYIKDLCIKLPVTSTGEPDWQFMEDYIKSLPYGDCL